MQLARTPCQASFRQTLGRLNDCQSALQQANPYSACVIAYASSFAYRSGILCYITSGDIRILNFNDRWSTEKVLEGDLLINYVLGTRRERAVVDLEAIKSIQIFEYAEDTIILFCDFGVFGQYVFAVDISDARPLSEPGNDRHPRVRLCVPVRSPNKLFARHSHQFLVMGSHSATGSHGHHEWLLEVFDLERGLPVNAEPLQLSDFHGSEVGSTVCFTIHEGCFYAVTSQTSVESEEVDWTSSYHVIQFRLDKPPLKLPIEKIWRRQHLEGPINDAWADLDFQRDHSTGELLLVECRKEWVNGGSRAFRTYYTQPIARAERKNVEDGLRHPPTQDRLISTLDKNSNSSYEEPRERVDRYVHAEYDATNEANTKEYIRAKTKWNGYDFNAQSFVDLVTDDFVPEGGWRPQQRIKLRVVSRQEICPLVRDETAPGHLIIRPRFLNREKVEMEDSERLFSPSQVHLWPPDDASQELHDILCPKGRAGEVTAVLGDEGIIYMAGPAREPGSAERALVFICFDPTFGYNGMKRADGTLAIAKRDKKRKSTASDQTAESSLIEANYAPLLSPSLAENTKKLKLELHDANTVSARVSCAMTTDEKPEPDLPVPAQGDLTVQALGLDPPSPPVLIAPTPALWPPPSPSGSTPRSQAPAVLLERPSSAEQDRGKEKGKGRAKTPPSTLSTWRENAVYLSIGKGFWLR